MKAKKFTIEGTPRGNVANVGKVASIGQAAAIIETEKAKEKRAAAVAVKDPGSVDAGSFTGKDLKTLLEFVARYKGAVKEEKIGRFNMKVEPSFIEALSVLCRVLKVKKTRFVETAVKDAIAAKVLDLMAKAD